MPHPHLLPRIESEDQLFRLAEDGLLHEPTLGIEFKREIENNKELAKEIASLAVDGGVLLLGVVDLKHRPLDATPEQHLQALSDPQQIEERVQNVARTRITPPLHIMTRYILANTDSQKGYVVVDVPQSVSFPHMADSRYWGRAGSGKYPMADHEVRAHLDRRLSRSREARAELDAFADCTPASLTAPDADLDNPNNFNGTLHLVVVPTVARDDQAYRAWSDSVASPENWLGAIAARSHIETQSRTWLIVPRIERAPGRYILSNVPFRRTGEPQPDGPRQPDNGMLWWDVRMIELTKSGLIRAYEGMAVEVSQWTGNYSSAAGDDVDVSSELDRRDTGPEVAELHVVVADGGGQENVGSEQVEVRWQVLFGEPKTKASRRAVSMPRFVAEELSAHLSVRAPVEAGDLVFTSPEGAPLRRKHFRSRVWAPTVKQAGMEDPTFNGLRHSAVRLTIEVGPTPG